MSSWHGRFRRACFGAVALLAILFCDPSSLHAAKGDCAQPVTTGTNPTASDCLVILRAAVGSEACDPACICAPKGSLPTTASDALVCLKKAVGQPVTLSCPCLGPGEGDDFNDNVKDAAKWGDDFVDGNGVLTETAQVLEYTCASGTSYDQSLRPWEASVLPFDSDWETQLDVANFADLSVDDQINSFGISLVDASDFDSEIYAELYASRLQGPPVRKGFYAELLDKGSYVGEADTGGLGLTTGAVRMAFNASTKVVTLFYDVDSGNGYDWVEYGSFGLAGSGGASGNADWGLSGSDPMLLAVYGYSSLVVVAAGEVYGDNFWVRGGVAQ